MFLTRSYFVLNIHIGCDVTSLSHDGVKTLWLRDDYNKIM